MAFQGIPGLENAGFFIPPEVIQHFQGCERRALRWVSNGRHPTGPPAKPGPYRAFLGVTDDSIGARIDGILREPLLKPVSKPDDVLLSAGGLPVGSDGTVVYQENRMPVTVAFQAPQNGESVKLKILRDQAPLDVDLPVNVYDSTGWPATNTTRLALPRPWRAGVYASERRLPARWDANPATPRPPASSMSSITGEARIPRRLVPEPVVLASTLAHPVNADMGVRARAIIDKINGVKIDRLEDVVRALEKNTEGQHVIEFLGRGGFECLDREKAAAANSEILSTYGISATDAYEIRPLPRSSCRTPTFPRGARPCSRFPFLERVLCDPGGHLQGL